MTDPAWQIHYLPAETETTGYGEASYGDDGYGGMSVIAVDAINAPTPTLTRGTQATIRCLFRDGSVATESVTERYAAALDLIEFNGDRASTAATSYQSVPWYREDVPDEAPIDSFVIALTPAPDVDGRGFWAIVLGGTDESHQATRRRVVELELFVLGLSEVYPNHDAVAEEFAREAF